MVMVCNQCTLVALMNVKAIILGAAALAVCATATAAGPSMEQLKELLKSPTSDWSIVFSDMVDRPLLIPDRLDYDKRSNNGMEEGKTLGALAELDRVEYTKSHPIPIDGDTARTVGYTHAISHNLPKNTALVYSYGFRGSTKITVVCGDEQTSLMNRIRDNPTENFSQKADEDYGTYLYGLLPLAEADARIYFEEHKGINKDQTGLIGMAQALRHHVPSVDGHFYATYFFRALDDLLEN
jgi:hypothetical protein